MRSKNDYQVRPTIFEGVYTCNGYFIRTAHNTGGKAGKDRNVTSTLQVTQSAMGGYLLQKQYRFTVCDKSSYDRAEQNCIDWIKRNPLKEFKL